MANTIYINEELRLYVHKEYIKTVKSSIQSGNSRITINNLQSIETLPYIELSIKKSVTNPILYFKNNSIQTNVQLNGQFQNGDKIILDSVHKSIMKNNLRLNLTPSLFPIIKSTSYFEIFIDNTVADITIQYKTHEDKALYVKSREDFNLQNNSKVVELGKAFHNSDSKQNLILGGNSTFDFSCPMYDDYFISMINKSDTYRVVVDLDNTDDEFSRMQLILCNCTLQSSVSSGSNSPIQYKVTGQGILLGSTPPLSIFYQSDAIQLILTNLTRNLTYELPFTEINSTKFNTKYREKKVFRQPVRRILESLEVSVDLNCLLTDSRIKDWIGDSLTADINYHNSKGSIPLTINNVVIENLNFNSEKDGLVKCGFSLTGNL